QPGPRVRQGVPDGVHQVRRPERDAQRGHRTAPAPTVPGRGQRPALRGEGVRRPARAVPADRQAGGLQAAQHRKCGAAESQQRAELPGLAGDGGAGRGRGGDRLPPARRGGLAMPQHFVAPPQWEWYIVWYFFLGGLAGGAYALGAILRLFGDRRDAGAARLAFLVALPALAICPILLTLDLGRPLRFWHMLIDSRTMTLNFKYWSPMSVGVWALLIFSAFAFLSFLEAVLGE